MPEHTRPTQNFPKAKRLLYSKQYRFVLEKKQKFQATYFTLLWFPNSLGYDRLGLIISKKVGHSVTRNWLKRVIREWFRKKEQNQSIDLIFIAKIGANTQDCLQIQQELTMLLECAYKSNRGKNTDHEFPTI